MLKLILFADNYIFAYIIENKSYSNTPDMLLLPADLSTIHLLREKSFFIVKLFFLFINHSWRFSKQSLYIRWRFSWLIDMIFIYLDFPESYRVIFGSLLQDHETKRKENGGTSPLLKPAFFHHYILLYNYSSSDFYPLIVPLCFE